MAFGISVAILFALFRIVPVDEVVAATRGAAPLGVLGVLVWHLVAVSLRVVRWRALLRDAGCLTNEHPWLATDALMVGWLGNVVFPGRLGEALRPAIYSRRAGVPFARVLATVAVERVMDLVVVAAGFSAVLALLPASVALPEPVRVAARVVSVVTLAALAVLWAAARSGVLEALGRRAGDGLAGRALERFSDGLATLRDPSASLRVLGWTAAIWTAETICVLVGMVAFGLAPHWGAAIGQVVAATVSIAIVTVPGGLGVEQGATVLVFSAWGIDPAAALATSLVLTLGADLWVVLGGLLGLWRTGSRLH